MVIRNTLRRIVFLAFITLFLVVGTYLTIKMLGFVIDTKHMQLTKASGIFVSFTPSDSILYLDGDEYPGKVGFMGKDIYVPGLMPGTHTVSLKKDGYYDWNKELTLESGRVASAKDVTLWPKTLTPLASSTDVSSFWLTKNGPLTKNSKGQLAINKTKIKGKNVILSNSDSKFVVTSDAGAYYFMDLDNTSTTINVATVFNKLKSEQLKINGVTAIHEVISHPFTRTTLVITTNSSIYLLDMKKMSLEKLFSAEKLVTYATSNNSIFAVDSRGTLTVMNLLMHTKSEYPIHLEFASRIIADPEGSNLIIIDSENKAFLYEVGAEILKKIGTDISFFSFSPDSKRAIIISRRGEAQIIYLKDYEDNVVRKNGDVSSLILNEQEDALTFAWMPLEQNYFLIKADGTMMIEEFDMRGKRNIYKIAKDAKQFAIHDNTLYLLNNSGLLTYQKLSAN
ncbi:MAG: PEGA domain-containing protein [Candidatus Jorgensenbacteria bacterium]|nr:PEGA domain-containing protein [Candidatus Jorgensenbacteria bacterium]